MLDYFQLKVIDDYLGFPGRMISGSKTAKPGHTVYWNAIIFDDKRDQIWHGDIDITESSDILQDIADTIGKTLYVTREHPFRFEGLSRKDIKKNPEVLTFKVGQ